MHEMKSNEIRQDHSPYPTSYSKPSTSTVHQNIPTPRCLLRGRHRHITAGHIPSNIPQSVSHTSLLPEVCSHETFRTFTPNLESSNKMEFVQTTPSNISTSYSKPSAIHQDILIPIPIRIPRQPKRLHHTLHTSHLLRANLLTRTVQ